MAIIVWTIYMLAAAGIPFIDLIVNLPAVMAKLPPELAAFAYLLIFIILLAPALSIVGIILTVVAWLKARKGEDPGWLGIVGGVLMLISIAGLLAFIGGILAIIGGAKAKG